MYVVDSLHACGSSDEHVQSARDYHYWVVNGKHEIVSQGNLFFFCFAWCHGAYIYWIWLILNQ